MADDKPQINVTSYNQSGGVTANTVNIGNQRLRLVEELKTALLMRFPTTKPIETEVIGETGPGVCSEIEDFLRANGRNVIRKSTVLFQAPPPRRKLAVREFPDKFVFTIAPDALE